MRKDQYKLVRRIALLSFGTFACLMLLALFVPGLQDLAFGSTGFALASGVVVGAAAESNPEAKSLIDPAMIREAVSAAFAESAKETVRGVVEMVPQASVKTDRSIDGEGAFAATARLLSAIGRRDYQAQADIQHELARAGHYGEDRQAEAMKQERAVMLTSVEGQPFLPVTVLGVIEDVMRQYGAARRHATVIRNLRGTVKIPNVSGRLTAFATNEGSIIKARKPTFNSQSLDPKKWGVIVPWSNEMSEEVGAELVGIIVRLAGEAFAKAEDETVFTADGTAAFHSITGILNNAAVPAYTMPATMTSFDKAVYADFVKTFMMVRSDRAGLFVHPDFKGVFALWQSNAGYIYPPGQPINQMNGRYIDFSEALPNLATASQPGKHFAAVADLSYVTMGFQRDLTATLLTEATIQDVDDTTLIHLGAQDSQALRFTALWDVKFGLAADAAARMKTAAA